MKSTLALVVVAVSVAVTLASVGFDKCATRFANGDYNYPHVPTGGVKLCRSGDLAIAFDTKMIAPAWSAYHVTPAHTSHDIKGRDKFYQDPDLESMGVTQPPTHGGPFNFTWQRGHCAPSHAMSYSAQAKLSTYTMANVAVQAGRFNMGDWEKLETHVFDYIANGGNALHIITGVAYNSRYNVQRTIDNIAVPDYYFKVICDLTAGKSAGFYGKNIPGSGTGTLQYRTVAQVENLYGGNLFPASACDTSNVDPSHWWAW